MKPHFSPKVTCCSSRGFSLVELLMVIAVVAVLAAILFPVYRGVQQKAESSKCATNMRSIGAAFLAYSADHGGYLPAARLHPGADSSLGRQNQNGHWETELAEYVGFNIRKVALDDGNVSLMICPGGRTGMNANTANREMDNEPGDNLSGPGDYQTPLALVPDPTNTVLLGDSDNYHHGVWKGMTSSEESGEYQSGDPIRHDGKANYLFVDGHVELLNLEDALQVIARGRGNL